MDEATIISDIHLGSGVCQAKPLSDFLHHIKQRTRKLILNGDLFENMDFRRLRKRHWNVLSLLRKASDDIEMIWLAGNHDGPADIISHLLGVEIRREYIFESGGRRILCLHGDKFDRFLDDHPWLTRLGDAIYGALQWLDKSHYFARLAKSNSKHYLRCHEIIQNEAVHYARRRGCDAVCCGHTHQAMTSEVYYNCGCWTENPCTYLTVNHGTIALHQYQPGESNADRERAKICFEAGHSEVFNGQPQQQPDVQYMPRLSDSDQGNHRESA